MAKRKAARATRRKAAAAPRRAGRGRSAARKAAVRKRTAKKAARASVGRSAKAAPRKSAKAPARKTTARRPKAAVKANAKSTAARKAPARSASRSAPPAQSKANRPVARTAPSLNRERRTIVDDDVVPTPPSSLDLDRSASAVRTGRREMKERFAEHTETSPAMTGGDVDADWESAYSVGDEAPGGDNPTPDQDIVDDIGHAIGVEYQDNEELKGEAKISKRDRNRWELDPASSDDWDER
jgi:uncharacterized protein DUF6335